MRDDFGALDFLSADGFHLSPEPGKRSKKQKKKLGLSRRKATSAERRTLKDLLPFLGDRGAARAPGLGGWPVTLSWPGQAEPGVESLDRRSARPRH